LTQEGLQPNIYHTWDRVLIITLSLSGDPTHDLSHLRRVLIITLSLSGAPTHDLSHLRRVLIITLSLSRDPTHDLSHLRRVLIITLSMNMALTHDLSHLRRVTSPMLFSSSIRSTHKPTYLGLKQFYFLVLQRNWQFWDSP
jgi:hypothetical protein